MPDRNDEMDLDQILAVLANPIRRMILKKLSTETNYPLQLSRELNVSQQALMKHMRVLEETGFIRSVEERSNKGGPPRNLYVVRKRMSVRIDLGPNTFEEKLFSFDAYGEGMDDAPFYIQSNRLSFGGNVTGEILPEVDGVLPAYTDPFLESMRRTIDGLMKDDVKERRLYSLRRHISLINKELSKLEERRRKILELRERAFEMANSIIVESARDPLERDVYSLLIKNDIDDLEFLSDMLQTRSKVIAEILKDLKRKGII
ncbi:MAG: helix-turn-helix domain-containing protein [Candidatus Thermoplasmatota archaeon]|nr:helix-turn-helix domain-containing protein [Candidatus Thermoplasmatota archaeon]